MALDKRLDQIEVADIEALQTNQTPEGKTLDYKRDRVGDNDDAKREFRADVTSFANASGGYIVFGVDEDKGVPTGIPGLTIPDPDREILRLESMIRDGVQPRIPNLASKAIPLSNGNYCFVVRIPQSWAMPHAVLHKGYIQFFSRNSNGKYPLDVPEVRAAFLLSGATAERIRAFRAERLSKIIAGETPVPLRDGAKVVYHLIPAGAFSSSERIDLTLLTPRSYPVEGIYNFGTSSRYNLDGIVFHNLGEYIQPGTFTFNYAQVFRNGIIEAVDGYGLSNSPGRIFGYTLDARIAEHVQGLLANCRSLAVEPPLFLMVSMIGVSGVTITINTMGGSNASDFRPIQNDLLLLPDTQIDDYDVPATTIVKPILDTLWNAAGWERSRSYDANGMWDEKINRRY